MSDKNKDHTHIEIKLIDSRHKYDKVCLNISNIYNINKQNPTKKVEYNKEYLNEFKGIINKYITNKLKS